MGLIVLGSLGGLLTASTFLLLGDQIRDGARFAASANGIELVEIDETCDEQGDETIAQRILEAGANAAVGFLCTEDLRAVLPKGTPTGQCGLPENSLKSGGDYCWEETVVPVGWAKADGGCFTAGEGGPGSSTNVTIVPVKETSEYTRIEGNKFDQNDPSNKLAGGVFDLYLKLPTDCVDDGEGNINCPSLSEELAAQISDANRPAIAALAKRLETAAWDKAAINQAIKDTMAEFSLKMPQVAIPVRLLVCGRAQTPSVDAVLALFDRDVVLQRLSQK